VERTKGAKKGVGAYPGTEFGPKVEGEEKGRLLTEERSIDKKKGTKMKSGQALRGKKEKGRVGKIRENIHKNCRARRKEREKVSLKRFLR